MIQADFFILTALNIETQTLKRHLEDVKWIQGTPYTRGTVATREGSNKYIIVFAQCDDTGINPPSALVKKAVEDYDPRYVLLIGIAAGFPENNIQLGDVIIPEWISPYAKAKVMPGRIEHRGRPLPITASTLLSIARKIVEYEGHTWYQDMVEQRPNNFVRDYPKVFANSNNVLGSGPKVVADELAEERKWLLDTYKDNAVGLEVEAADTALECRECETNFLVIKAAQDDATGNKDTKGAKDLWRAYAADAAATFAITLIKCVPLQRMRTAFAAATSDSENINTSKSSFSINSDQFDNLRPYLAWMRNKCQDLKLQSLLDRTPLQFGKIRLQNVYLSLDTRERVAKCEDRTGREYRILPSDIEASGIQAVGNWHLVPMTVEESLDFHKNVILLGPPGAGKTIVLNHLALFLASAATIDQVEWSEASKKLRWTHGPLVPISISLKDFSNSPSFGSSAGSLWEYIEHQIKPADEASLTIRNVLSRGGAEILLDELDKVPKEKRSSVISALMDFYNLYSSCRYVLTCREMDYHSMEESLTPPFHVITLAPLAPDKVYEFIKIWYREFRDLGWKILEGSDEELKNSIRSHDLVSLAQNPRLLTELTAVHCIHHRIPKDRVGLFSEVVDLLLSRYTFESAIRQQSDSRIGLPKVKAEELHRAMCAVAYSSLVQKTANTTGMNKAKITDVILEAVGNDKTEAVSLIEIFESELGVITDTGNQTYEFPNSSIQEYLASEYLASNHDFISCGVDTVRNDFSKWHNVFAMATQLTGIDVGISAIRSLCPDNPPVIIQPDSIKKEQWYIAWMAAEALCEFKPEETKLRPERRQIMNSVVGWLIALIHSNALSPNERNEVAELLSYLGDTRVGVCTIEPDLIQIPKGPVVLGYDRGDAGAFTFNIAYEYFVSKYLVTNAQYFLYLLDNKGSKVPDDEEGIWDQNLRTVKPKYLTHPVVGVNWNDAKLFCNWLTQKLRSNNSMQKGFVARLPTDPEWTKMYRGGTYLQDGSENPNATSVYPWGNEWKEGFANVPESKFSVPHTTVVGIYPFGATPYGVLDACGNVLEWTNTSWGSFDSENPGFTKSYNPLDGRESEDAEGFRILRGGSWLFSEGDAKCACRLDPSSRYPDTGFRVIVGPEDTSLQ